MRSLNAKDGRYDFEQLVDLALAEPVVAAKHWPPIAMVMAAKENGRLKLFQTDHVDSRPSAGTKAE